MFKVECPGCNAPYQVDERRVPATGLKMRCPKCGTSFKVDAPAEAREPSSGTAPEEAAAPPPPRRLGRNSPLKSTMLGVPPPGAGGPPGLRARTGEGTGPVRTFSGAYDEVDLPTVGGRATAPEPPKPALPEADLPAPVANRHDRADLPAAAPPRPRPRAPEPPPPPPAPRRPRQAEPVPELGDVDLPAALSVKLKPPQPPGDVDLPVVGRASAKQDPAAKKPPVASASSTRETEPEPVIPDLPSVGFARPQSGFGEIDLPSTVQGKSPPPPSAREFALDLEADLPSAAAEFPGLPSPAAGLPALSADLPAPGAELPNPFAALPTPAAGLPSPAAGLPSPSVGLPSPAAGLPRVSAPPLATPSPALPSGGSGLSLATEDFSAVPPLAEAPPRPAGASGQHRSVGAGAQSHPALRLAEPREHFGELELPQGAPAAPAASAAALVADFGAGSSVAGPQVVRQAGGGVAYGEVNLDGADALPPAEPAVATAAADDMEFGAIPQEVPKPATRVQAPGVVRPAPAPAPASAVAARESTDLPRARPGKRRGGRVVAQVIALVAIGGGAQALVPVLGPVGG